MGAGKRCLACVLLLVSFVVVTAVIVVVMFVLFLVSFSDRLENNKNPQCPPKNASFLPRFAVCPYAFTIAEQREFFRKIRGSNQLQFQLHPDTARCNLRPLATTTMMFLPVSMLRGSKYRLCLCLRLCLRLRQITIHMASSAYKPCLLCDCISESQSLISHLLLHFFVLLGLRFSLISLHFLPLHRGA